MVDINECDLDLDNCDINAQCEDSYGNFTCSCNFGYAGNGNSCSM